MLKSCGKRVNIETNALFSPKVEPGNCSGIEVEAKIYGACVIGDYVMMGENCTIITRNHRHSRTDIPMMEQGFEEERPVFIGNDVRIGDRITILPGVHIGDGFVIGAGAVFSQCNSCRFPCEGHPVGGTHDCRSVDASGAIIDRKRRRKEIP